jgi:hypothetical protein
MKGAEKVVNTFIAGAFIIGIFLVLILFFINYYVQTNAIIKSSDVERHAIALGNLYLSSDLLTYTNGKTLYRDVFSKEKLDKEMINSGNIFSYTKIFSDSDIFNQISYPNSVVILYVQDGESNDKWFLVGHGPVQAKGFGYADYGDCLVQKLKLDPATLGRLFIASQSSLGQALTYPVIWDKYDFKECEASYNAQVGYSIKSFPVAIQTPNNDIHEGYLVVMLREI